VYKDLRRLIRLRDKAFEAGSTYTAGMQQQLKAGLQVLQDVANEVEKRVLLNVKDCLELAGNVINNIVDPINVVWLLIFHILYFSMCACVCIRWREGGCRFTHSQS
jgi:hypothetical protein